MFETTLPLRGPGGEPVDFPRTIASHGVAELPPMQIDHATRSFSVTLPITGRPGARTVTVTQRGKRLDLTSPGRSPSAADTASMTQAIRTILDLDEDLTPFYDLVRDDPDLAWVASGAGRMIRSATVFEEVVKTVCTTNCAWSATERMVGAIVEHLGTPAPGAAGAGPLGRTFPSAATMAQAGEDFYRKVARAGYRARSLHQLARDVADGSIDLEILGTDRARTDDDVEQALLALPGVGPYAAAHVMMMLGRSRTLILDSWTRPTYARIVNARRLPTDATITRRFRRYGRYAGLAFWLTCTRSWVEP